MSQAEIAAGRVASPGELPKIGIQLRGFELWSASGGRVQLSDYRGRANLVLIFADDGEATAELISELARSYEQFKREEAEIIIVRHDSRAACARFTERLNLPLIVLADEDGRIHREVGASDGQGYAATAVYVTDRYGEVFALYRTREGQIIPTAAEILKLLEFINSQCPECEPPEWPV